MKTLLLTLTMCVFVLPADAQYSGGTGEPNDPYQIATAIDLIALGETPKDYDKHFILTADIDLDPNLPGRKVFDRAVIASDGLGFSGVLDGNSHTISHLTINGGMNVGMFGWLRDGAEVRGLGMVDIDITGDNHVGGLVGVNSGTVIQCYSTASVMGAYSVGGLVGFNYGGSIAMSHSSSMVSGTDYYVGGLVGYNDGSVATSYSSGSVSGYEEVGGLVGVNGGTVLSSYAACDVTGDSYVGGLVGSNGGYCSRGDCPCFTGTICDCYSTGGVTGGDYVAGLVGYNMGGVNRCYSAGAVTGATTNISGLVVAGGECGYYMGPTYRVDYVNVCFWDVQVSGQATSDGGIGKNTAEMQTAGIFLETGWDFVGETENGTDDIWKIAEGLGYPRLWWEKYSGGTGEPNDPCQIATAADLTALG